MNSGLLVIFLAVPFQLTPTFVLSICIDPRFYGIVRMCLSTALCIRLLASVRTCLFRYSVSPGQPASLATLLDVHFLFYATVRTLVFVVIVKVNFLLSVKLQRSQNIQADYINLKLYHALCSVQY